MKNSYSDTLKPGEPALITELVGRRIAYPFALLAKKLGMSANAVTIVAGSCWMLSLPLPIWAGIVVGDNQTLSIMLWFSAGFLWNAGYILDIADGSLARMTRTASKRGFYLDNVFHFLFKPLFLLSIGFGLSLMNYEEHLWWLNVLAIASIPANWSLTQSVVQHVLCETTGRNRDNIAGAALNDNDFRKLWLGTNEINDSATTKRSAPIRLFKTCIQEIFSYYGQFTFFSVTVLLDIIMLIFWQEPKACCGCVPSSFRVTTFFFVTLTSILVIRVPFRIRREYKRIALADKK